MKLPNLRTLLFLQPFLRAMYPAYFLLIWSVDNFSINLWFLGIFIVCEIVEAWVEKRIKAQTDECALQTLRTAEASCMRSAEVFIVIAAIVAAANQASGGEPPFPWIMEHLPILLTIALFLIYLERAILFAYWDKKGLPPC